MNLIGEHTDYNGGVALPFAIEQGCTAQVRLRSAGFRAASAQYGETVLRRLDEVTRAVVWTRFVLGPAWVLAGDGVEVPPLEVDVDSDVPSGGGLSSSAALLCSVVAALDELLELGLSAEQQVRLAVRAENEVVGAPTGGLDQLVSVCALEGHALLCDFSSADLASIEQVPFDLGAAGLAVLVVDTGVRHLHADGEYAERRRACARAAAVLGVDSLGQFATARLDWALDRLDDELRRCVRHVVTENERVREVAALLTAGRLDRIGPSLSASHASLRDDYRVSCFELDLAVEAMEASGALGARMTGGGFGGCAIGLVRAEEVDTVAAAVTDAYAGAGRSAPRWFLSRPSAGVRPDRL